MRRQSLDGPQHVSLVGDIGRKKVKKVVRKTFIERRKIILLNVVKIRKQCEGK